MIIMIILFILINPVSLCAETSGERYLREVEDEIKRHHQLQMVEKQTEVIGRLELLGKDDVVNNVSSNQSTYTHNDGSEVKNVWSGKRRQK